MSVPSSGRIFKSPTADDVLRTLIELPEREFTISELAESTDAAPATVRRAVTLLSDLDLLEVRHTPQRKYVSIDQRRLDKPDPILAIEQSEFQKPVRAFVNETLDSLRETDEVRKVVGILLFGSVARGEADRRSDIDVLVVVDGNKTVARRVVNEIVAELRDRSFDGDRYEFQPMVESVESVRRIGDQLRDQFDEGITLHATEELVALRQEVQNGE